MIHFAIILLFLLPAQLIGAWVAHSSRKHGFGFWQAFWTIYAATLFIKGLIRYAAHIAGGDA